MYYDISSFPIKDGILPSLYGLGNNDLVLLGSLGNNLMGLIAGIGIISPYLVVILRVAFACAVSLERSTRVPFALSVLTKRLTKLGFEDCEYMPGQYNHLLCPMVHILVSYVLLNLLF